MKLLEKLKNTFFEEEYIEVEEPERKEVVARKVEPREIKKEEVVVSKIEEKKENQPKPQEKRVDKKIENYSDSELIKKESKVPYYEDDDFVEEKVKSVKKEEPRKIYGESADKLYNSLDFSNNNSNKPYSAPAKEVFKPTPIISPIYGVLDKNYKKEEVIDKKDKPSSYVSRRNADLDSIRRKAYGDFESSVEKEIIEEVPVEDNLLYDMTTDNTKPIVDQVTIADAEEYFEDLGLEYNIDYKDSRYEKATGRRTSSNTKKIENEIDDSEDDANLEDNLFDLIDSMYEDGEK